MNGQDESMVPEAASIEDDGSPIDGLNALLAEIIDYAGLFPPAALEMEPTVANYASYVAGEHAWMLGRLIVPVDRLDEFERCAAGRLPRGEDDEPWHISGLTAPAGDDRLSEQLERIVQYNRDHEMPGAGLARIDVIELKASTAGAIDHALDLLPDELYPFFELPITDDARGLIAALVGSDAGAKVRTGGVTAELYPDPSDLARFIEACAGAHVPFKATAGLHHPLRHHSQSVGVKEFGFLNVFIAAALAQHERFDRASIEAVLVDESPSSFTIDPAGVGWTDHRLPPDAIADTREERAISFGSCSFTEPIDDLRSLKLL